MGPIRVFGDHEAETLTQLERCVAVEDDARGVLCADGHLGYSMPIGGVVAYRDHVSPSGVGFDIGCLAAGTPVTTEHGFSLPIEGVGPGEAVSCWDGLRVRRATPCEGSLARGRRPVLRLRLANGRELVATADHEIRTKLGWQRLDALRRGDAVACPVFTGVPYEPPRATEIAIAEPDPRRVDELAARGLWPLRTDDARLPALLRLLGYALGDGHLHRDGRGLSLHTAVLADAAALAADAEVLGFAPRVHWRDRGPGRRLEHHVKVGSVALHALFAALGCPVGQKVRGWPEEPLPWVFGLPAWMRALLLSAFASAEATTPALVSGRVPNVAMKQAGTTRHAIDFVGRLVESLGFRAGISASGPARGAVTTHVAQVLGGEAEQLRFFEEVGFCRAVEKREAAANVASVAWQTEAERAARRAAGEDAHRLAASGLRIRDVTATVAAKHGVPRGFAHHALYSARGLPRRPAGPSPPPDFSGEVAWVAVASVERAGEAEVHDVVTGDPAQSFVGGGICVHNCGNKAVRTTLTHDDVAADLPRIMDRIFSEVSFGIGRGDGTAADHPVIDEIRRAPFAPQRKLADLAARQLGTVGAGNHYVDLFRDEEDRVWVGVHFGSRGFGHKTASGFLAIAQGKAFEARATDTGMMSAPVVFHAASAEGEAYVEAMALAGRYAYAGRDVVVDQVCAILGAEYDLEVHNNHNYAWRETHGGESVWVTRKGATPAFPGQLGFVGATMGEPAVILEGVESPASEEALFSTVHGAGRAMSRTAAAGRWRHGKMVKAPAIDFNAVQRELTAKGIELRGGAADEAPLAYKRLPDVLAHHAGTVRVLHELRPIGVAMAPARTFDPFRD